MRAPLALAGLLAVLSPPALAQDDPPPSLPGYNEPIQADTSSGFERLQGALDAKILEYRRSGGGIDKREQEELQREVARLREAVKTNTTLNVSETQMRALEERAATAIRTHSTERGAGSVGNVPRTGNWTREGMAATYRQFVNPDGTIRPVTESDVDPATRKIPLIRPDGSTIQVTLEEFRSAAWSFFSTTGQWPVGMQPGGKVNQNPGLTTNPQSQGSGNSTGGQLPAGVDTQAGGALLGSSEGAPSLPPQTEGGGQAGGGSSRMDPNAARRIDEKGQSALGGAGAVGNSLKTQTLDGDSLAGPAEQGQMGMLGKAVPGSGGGAGEAGGGGAGRGFSGSGGGGPAARVQRAGRGGEGEEPAFRSDGSPIPAGELVRRPDFDKILPPAKFNDLQQNFQSRPELRGAGAPFQDIGMTPKAPKSFEFVANCNSVEKECNKSVRKKTYRSKDPVEPEDLADIWKRIKEEASKNSSGGQFAGKEGIPKDRTAGMFNRIKRLFGGLGSGESGGSGYDAGGGASEASVVAWGGAGGSGSAASGGDAQPGLRTTAPGSKARKLEKFPSDEPEKRRSLLPFAALAAAGLIVAGLFLRRQD